MPANLSYSSPRSSSDRHSMGFSSIFKRKSESNISIVSRTPSLLSRRSSKGASTQNSRTSSHGPVHYPESPQDLVPPSFPAPQSSSVAPAIAITNPSGTTFEPPPAYSEAPPPNAQRSTGTFEARKISVTTDDDPYAFLYSFDIVFLIDDSGSMAGRSWRETADALAAVAPICAAHDRDGVDVVFMNTRQDSSHRHLKTADDINRVFASTRPGGATPTGATLDRILRPYLHKCETRGHGSVDPMNIIVITDGVPTDDPESVIVQAAKRLEKINAPGWQVGIQFFQVGNEPGAAEGLAELDDGLIGPHCPRDIVDTIPWKGQLSARGMLKVVLGAVNRGIDRRRDSGERAR